MSDEYFVEIVRGSNVMTSRAEDWRFGRYKTAYLEMARRTKYRPGAPSDGLGAIMMTEAELLGREAAKYAADFLRQDDTTKYRLMGCPDGAVNKAFFFALEGAR